MSVANAELDYPIKLKYSDGETYTFSDGSLYFGDIKNDLPNGLGIHINFDFEYHGEWKDGLKHGQGSYDDKNYENVYYDGEWLNGKKNGQGKFVYGVDGSFYDGEWLNDKKNGQGTMTLADGTVIKSEWKNSDANGNGSINYADGAKYIGELKDNEKHGTGTFIFTDGSKYNGEFKNDTFNGYGTFADSSGFKYVGEMKNGLRHGQGTFINNDGTKYVGEFKNSKMDGPGTFVLLDGSNHTGEYKNGSFISSNSDLQNSGTSVSEWLSIAQQGFDMMSGNSSAFSAASQTCFKTGEVKQAFNKICEYKCGLTTYTTNLGSGVGLCPSTIQR